MDEIAAKLEQKLTEAFQSEKFQAMMKQYSDKLLAVIDQRAEHYLTWFMGELEKNLEYVAFQATQNHYIAPQLDANGQPILDVDGSPQIRYYKNTHVKAFKAGAANYGEELDNDDGEEDAEGNSQNAG